MKDARRNRVLFIKNPGHHDWLFDMFKGYETLSSLPDRSCVDEILSQHVVGNISVIVVCTDMERSYDGLIGHESADKYDAKEVSNVVNYIKNLSREGEYKGLFILIGSMKPTWWEQKGAWRCAGLFLQMGQNQARYTSSIIDFINSQPDIEDAPAPIAPTRDCSQSI